ncbi:toll/interleukin-1 receptor domain-containing protein [Arcobacter lanthieri]|uniref:toll/interleukin-1 receptor domain-containing protein n=1 Tax=Aliarcobacter lanthieri TaxID=1355374 RepID=UPI0019204DD5|nr:toll/interleukin-1 receptor domain-containing protein [Aliarcobacter lanthieri]MBL3518907.1 toll/interleukin-1 receptor domain-containing protein [Aliarcobacter lanthieri]
MKPRERIRLINEIALKLQEEMKYSEIDMYLPSFGINCKDYQPSTNSKKQATNLRSVLKSYGISGFVAHVDIEPSKEWQSEIEIALHTMDAIVVILMEGFKESNWCDQEVGFAVGKDTLIIPIKKDLDPYGFIAKYQAINGNNKNVGEVAQEVFTAIIKHSKSKNKMLSILTNLVGKSTNVSDAIKRINILINISNIPEELLVQMLEQIYNNSILKNSNIFISNLNNLLEKYQMTFKNKDFKFYDDIDENEIPF